MSEHLPQIPPIITQTIDSDTCKQLSILIDQGTLIPAALYALFNPNIIKMSQGVVMIILLLTSDNFTLTQADLERRWYKIQITNKVNMPQTRYSLGSTISKIKKKTKNDVFWENWHIELSHEKGVYSLQQKPVQQTKEPKKRKKANKKNIFLG